MAILSLLNKKKYVVMAPLFTLKKEVFFLATILLMAALSSSCIQNNSSSNSASKATYYFLSCGGADPQIDTAVQLELSEATQNTYSSTLTIEDAQIVSDGYECLLVSSNALSSFENPEYLGVIGNELSADDTKEVLQTSTHFTTYFPFHGDYNILFNSETLELTIKRAVIASPTRYLKGIALIADFADRTFEMHTGDGFNSELKLKEQLDEMEAHWSWLSRGVEHISWEIKRVTLPTTFSEDAYPNWIAFRTAVIEELAESIDADEYDQDNDGDIDLLWILPANGETNPAYLAGGASWTSGAQVFVDAQNSRSVIEKRTGNFNHEVGHLRGLPDLYGSNSTIHNLSLMDSSWPLPPGDFTPYERLLLGWLQPYFAEPGTQRAVLENSANKQVALKIPSSRDNEYFLIEYRKTPDSGYGSINSKIDGLVIYHVLEGSSQSQDFPLIAVVPADGSLSVEDTLSIEDVLTPQSPSPSYPFILRSYFGNEELARISDLSLSERGMQFDLTLSHQSGTSQNLLSNPSIEFGNETPDSWSTGGWRVYQGIFTWSKESYRSGLRSLELTASTKNDIYWENQLSNLEVGKSYSACGYLKADDVKAEEGVIGVNIGIAWTDSNNTLRNINRGGGIGSYDWKKVCVVFEAEQERQTVQCRLGAWAQTASGSGYCDDFYVERIE